jgi:hypothetical protein
MRVTQSGGVDSQRLGRSRSPLDKHSASSRLVQGVFGMPHATLQTQHLGRMQMPAPEAQGNEVCHCE